MQSNDLNQLLYDEQSPTLDFKRDQYPFSKATDDIGEEVGKFPNPYQKD